MRKQRFACATAAGILLVACASPGVRQDALQPTPITKVSDTGPSPQLAPTRQTEASTTSSPSPTRPPHELRAEFHFADEIEPLWQNRIGSALTTADQFLYTHFGVAPTTGAVFVSEDTGWLAARFREWMGIANPDAHIGGVDRMAAVPGAIFVNLSNVLSPEHNPPISRASALAHEWFHVLQSDLAGAEPSPEAASAWWGPAWLLEGSAVYVQSLLESDARNEDLQVHLDWFRSKTTEIPYPLEDMSTRDGLMAAGMGYEPGVIAVDQLVSRAGDQSLIDFFALQEDGTSWQSAFQSAFGITVPDFYREFEALRTASQP